MWHIDGILSGNFFDLLLILLGFLGASAFKFKEGLTITILILRLMRWGVHILRKKERDELKAKLDVMLHRLTFRNQKPKFDDDMIG